MQSTSFIGRQEFGISFVYTKYFIKLREQQKRRRSVDKQPDATPQEDKEEKETIVSLYNFLLVLFTRAKQYAVIHRCLCNAYRTRPGDVNQKKLRDNRKKFSETLEQISSLSRKIEELPLGKAGVYQLILQRNIRLHALMFIEELSLRMSENVERIAFMTEGVEEKARAPRYCLCG